MADTIDVDTEQNFTPNKNGTRMTGRAFNSANWRVKSDESPNSLPSRSSNHQSNDYNNSSRTSFNRGSPQQPSPAIAEGRRLYVGNMPYTAKKEEVEALFVEGNYQIERIDISVDPFTGRNPSYCFVELATKEQADRAMVELDGCDLLGRQIKVKPGVAKSNNGDRSFQRSGDTNSPSTRNYGDRNNQSSGYDRWQRNDGPNQSRGYNEQGRRLYVGGLPKLPDQQALENDLRDFFQGYRIEAISKLISPHPSKRFEPGDHYYLFVDFAHAGEANAALNALDGQEGPWGGKIKIGKARGDSYNNKNEERSKWFSTRDRNLNADMNADP